MSTEIEGTLYFEVAPAFRTRILAGALRPGARLPTIKQAAAEYSVSEVTVRRVLWLRERVAGLGLYAPRFLISGHSAGAHLGAMMLADPALDCIIGASLCSGVYDLAPVMCPTSGLMRQPRMVERRRISGSQ